MLVPKTCTHISQDVTREAVTHLGPRRRVGAPDGRLRNGHLAQDAKHEKRQHSNQRPLQDFVDQCAAPFAPLSTTSAGGLAPETLIARKPPASARRIATVGTSNRGMVQRNAAGRRAAGLMNAARTASATRTLFLAITARRDLASKNLQKHLHPSAPVHATRWRPILGVNRPRA